MDNVELILSQIWEIESRSRRVDKVKVNNELAINMKQYISKMKKWNILNEMIEVQQFFKILGWIMSPHNEISFLKKCCPNL